MRKTRSVKNDSQELKRLKGCLKDMRENSEIIHSVDAGEQKTDTDTFADLRQLLDNSAVYEVGMTYRGEK